MDVISVQSRVKRGYVGNAVAMPVLEATGVTAWAVDTVVYPHHPGHGPASPKVTEAAALTISLDEATHRCTSPACLLSGYLVNPEQGRIILDALAKARRDKRIGAYYLDPVFGDDAEGTYVDPALVAFFRDEALPQSTVLLPNRFELAALSGMSVNNTGDAVSAAHCLLNRGPEIVLVSSVPAETVRERKALSNLLVSRDGAWFVSVDALSLRAKGTGDMLSAAFCGLHAQGVSPPEALAYAVSLVDTATTDAAARDGDELDLPKILNFLNFSEKELPAHQIIESLEQ